MDEILATIRRIISEDEQASSSMPGSPAGGPRAFGAAGQFVGGRAATAADDDVLELTEALNPDGSVRHLAPIGSSSRGAGPVREPPLPAIVIDHEPLPELKPEPEVRREEPAMSREPGPTGGANDERLVAEVTSLATAAAFARLAAAPRERREPPTLGDRPLDDVVRDLLRPLLKTWLDENLPGIVERLVEAEIARVRRGPEPG